MTALAVICGVALILIVLWDGFETIVLPRRVTRLIRLTRLFYRATWEAWSFFVNSFCSARRREHYFSFYGPLSLLLLLTVWAASLIIGFGLLHWAAGPPFIVTGTSHGFIDDLYLSGTTFFTLGLGDVAPRTMVARLLTVVEAGTGFGFLALIIGYLPSLNQAFARREIDISLLDARAGSPPTAAEMLRRHVGDHGLEALRQTLLVWERWAADLLESHLAYPVLAYFRSQHDNQSWLGALTTILDTSAIVMAGLDGPCQRQAELTFAMARHAIVDLAIVFRSPPKEPGQDRLPSGVLSQLRANLAEAGLHLGGGKEADEKLRELRAMYEPYLNSLSHHLCMDLPEWVSQSSTADNWQTSAFERRPLFLRKKAQQGKHPHRHF